MIHRRPDPDPPLFARPPDPGPPTKNAAPLAGGAGVKDRNSHPDRTTLPLTPPVRRNAPTDTSHFAATRIAGPAAKRRADVLAMIIRGGAHGATDAEIEAATGIRAQSVSPRRRELRRLGLVADSGQRCPTPRGRPAAVWIATTATTAATPLHAGPGASADAGGSEGGVR